jgi:hypothetical protein
LLYTLFLCILKMFYRRNEKGFQRCIPLYGYLSIYMPKESGLCTGWFLRFLLISYFLVSFSVSLSLSLSLFIYLFFECVCVCVGTGNWTQSLTLARQAFYHLSHSSTPFYVEYFLDRVLGTLCLAGFELLSSSSLPPK